MRVLVLHPNFPAQFKHLLKPLAQKGHEVVFLCQTHYGRKIDGVRLLTLKGKYGHDELISNNLSIINRTKFLAEQYREALQNMSKNGWHPEVVISHSGWGCGLYVKEIWPKAYFISYIEWWFNPLSEFFNHDSKNKEIGIGPHSTKKNWDRNLYLALELSSSDKIVSPTEWQRNQLPDILREQCEVIFDGVDTGLFRASPKLFSEQPKLTYGTRGMDPFRGFPQFIKALPEVLNEIDIEIEIAGNPSTFYGNPPKNFKNWKDWAINYLNSENIKDKVTWKGFMQFEEYRKWLQSSWCHVYLTHPFVVSWSFVEALSANAPIISSDIEATREFGQNQEGIVFVDHRKPAEISQAIKTLFASSPPYVDRYDKMKIFDVSESRRKWGAALGLELST